MERYTVELTFTEALLGTSPLNEDIYTEHVGSNAPEGIVPQDEIESLEDVAELVEKGSTGFHRINGQPIWWDYQVKGFFKDACGMLRRVSGTRSSKLTAYRKAIDGLLFVTPRQITFKLNGGEMGWLERPLRAQTAKGERIALARSETIPAASSMEFEVIALGVISESVLKEWLDYGALRGMGQWRNAGYGRFTYKLTKQ